MATEVKLPDAGEGVEDVTINRWLVAEGDTINEGDILVEVATDKVDTEIPSPVSGTVLKLNFGEGELVDIDEVIAVIGEAGEEADGQADGQADGGEADETARAERPDVPEQAGADTSTGEADSEEPAPDENGHDATGEEESTDSEVKATPVARRMAAEEGVPLAELSGSGSGGQITKSDVQAYLDGQSAGDSLPDEYANVASLAVRRLAATYDIDLRDVAGDRPLSSLTRQEVQRYAAQERGVSHLAEEPDYPAQTPKSTPAAKAQSDGQAAKARKDESRAEEKAKSGRTPGAGETLVPHSRMRQIIAKNMVQSAFTAPHVTTVHTVDMTAVTSHYQAHKAEFAQQNVRLTLTAYIVAAVVDGLKAVPAANGEWTEEGLILKDNFNIGMAVALPADETGVGGLIVPVIRNAGDLNLTGIARQVADLAVRARDSKLTSADLQGGTFTLTNYGTSGSLFQTPVIFQPQVAILGTGAIEKRPVVVSRGKPYEALVDDYLAFHPMMDIALSYDHRVLDGASADAFCVAVKQALEGWS